MPKAVEIKISLGDYLLFLNSDDIIIDKLFLTKAKNILGWESDTSMDEILLTIYKWENRQLNIGLNKKDFEKSSLMRLAD